MSSSFSMRLMLMSVLIEAAVFMVTEVRAEENIGVASLIRNYVNGVLPTRTFEINVGESVIRDEIVKTGSDSQAKIVFTDSTNLAVGPNSIVKLDTFVAAQPGNYSQATLNVLKGAFRFTTGHSEKPAYEVHTPVATIGVRGTIYELFVEPRQTTINMLEGRVRACVKADKYRESESRRPRCCDVDARDRNKKAILNPEGCVLTNSSGPEMDCSTAGFCDTEQYAAGLPLEFPLLLPLLPLPPAICAAAGCFEQNTPRPPLPVSP